MLDRVLEELRWTVRYARRHPGLFLVVTASLTLTIAAATTAFGLARSVLWKPLPFDDASRLVFVWEATERDGVPRPSRVTSARYAAWRQSSRGVFTSLALFGAAGFTLEEPAGATNVRGVRASANYFSTLGITALLGRTFTERDEMPGQDRVVILSHAFWRERMGGRPDVVGQTLRLSGQPYTVIGVMPPVTFPAWPVNPAVATLDADSRQLWVPIPTSIALQQTGRAHVFGVIGRLADGVTPSLAAEALTRATDPSAPDAHAASAVPLREQFVADARTPLLTLAFASVAVLLIACANLASLYLSAFQRRRAELSVRAAIGAGRHRLVRQLALETALPAAAASVCGVVVARLALAALPAVLPPSIPFMTQPGVDAAAVAFAMAAALLATLLVTAWPIARLLASAPAPRGVAPRASGVVYRALVVSQIAVAVPLAVAAVLLGRSLSAIRGVDAGFTVENVFVADVGLVPPGNAPAETVTAAEQRLVTAVARVPGVVAATIAYDHPLEANWSEAPVVSGDAVTREERRQVELRIVAPSYFETLDVQMLEGRGFTEHDTLAGPGVAIVNEAFARELGGRAIGRRIQSGTPRFNYSTAPAAFEIVGVARNERSQGLDRPAEPAFYLSTRQFPQTSVVVLARTAGDPIAATASIRAAVRSADPAMTLARATSLARLRREQLAERTVTADVLGGFGLAALSMAALGLYGLLVIMVNTTTRDTGIKLALGASPRRIAGAVLRTSLASAVTGIAVGIALALASGRFIQSMLVDVSGTDAGTLAAVAATLLTAATLAAAAPARRAARTDPMTALRQD